MAPANGSMYVEISFGMFGVIKLANFSLYPI